MLNFLVELYGSIHFYFAELPSQLWKKLKTGKFGLTTIEVEGKRIELAMVPRGSLSSLRRFGGSPSIAMPTLFGGLIYAEEGLPNGVILHEIGHIVVPEARVCIGGTKMHGKNSAVAELAADDYSKRNGGGAELRRFLIEIKHALIMRLCCTHNVNCTIAEAYIDNNFDFQMRIDRLAE